MKTNNILFIDYDGPLFSFTDIRYHPDNRKPYPGDPDLREALSYWKMNERFVYTWNHLMDVFDFNVVISSSWRNILKRPEDHIDLFSTNGLRINLHDEWRTDNERSSDEGVSSWNMGRGSFMCHRHHQIQCWLKRHPEVTNWVAIDDKDSGGSLDYARQKGFHNHIVIVDEDRGLGSENIRHLISIMKGWK